MADASSESSAHIAALKGLFADPEFTDFVVDAFGPTCEASDIEVLDPLPYCALLLYGYFQGCRSDDAIEEKASRSADMLSLLDLDIDDPVPQAAAIRRTRQLLGIRAHFALIGWLNHEEFTASEATRTECDADVMAQRLPQISEAEFGSYLRSLDLAAGTGGQGSLNAGRVSMFLERRLTPKLLKSVFSVASNLGTTAIIVGAGEWLRGQSREFPGWGWAIILAGATTSSAGVILLALVLFDARTKIRGLKAHAVVRVLGIAIAAVVVVILAVLSSMRGSK